MNKLKQIINYVNYQKPQQNKKIKERVFNRIKESSKKNNTTQLQAALKLVGILEEQVKTTIKGATLDALKMQLQAARQELNRLQKAASYYQKNRKEILKYQASYYQANRVRIDKQHKEWRNRRKAAN